MNLFIKNLSLLLLVFIGINSFILPNNPENWKNNPQGAFKHAIQESSLAVVQKIIKLIKKNFSKDLLPVLESSEEDGVEIRNKEIKEFVEDEYINAFVTSIFEEEPEFPNPPEEELPPSIDAPPTSTIDTATFNLIFEGAKVLAGKVGKTLRGDWFLELRRIKKKRTTDKLEKTVQETLGDLLERKTEDGDRQPEEGKTTNWTNWALGTGVAAATVVTVGGIVLIERMRKR